MYCYSLKQQIVSLREQLHETELENCNLKAIADNNIAAKEHLEEAYKAEIERIANVYAADFQKYEDMITDKDNKIKELRKLLEDE